MFLGYILLKINLGSVGPTLIAVAGKAQMLLITLTMALCPVSHNGESHRFVLFTSVHFLLCHVKCLPVKGPIHSGLYFFLLQSI